MCDFNAENDPRSQIIHMKKIQAEGLELFIKKNADYGNSYKQFGLIGVLVRLQDKMNRAMNVTQNSIQVKDETLRDTLIDLHNYAAMALMEMEPCQQMMFRIRSEPTVPTQNPGSEPPLQSEPAVPNLPMRIIEPPLQSNITPAQRAALPDPQKSISDPSRNDAFDDCNHRNINLR
jgi:hypothetical protein